MRGNIQTQLLAVADGSFFDGQVNMPPRKPRRSGSPKNGNPAPISVKADEPLIPLAP